MKLIDIASNIDKSEKNKDWVDLQRIATDLRIDYYGWAEQDTLTSYWVGNWNCTDTWVGYKMYFFNNEPVCFSIQMARKSDENFHWFSKDAAIKVRDYVLSLIDQEDLDDFIEIKDINEDIGDDYKINFNANIIHRDKATLNGCPVKIIERIRKENDCGIDMDLLIELEDGKQVIENIENLRFRFNLNEN